MYKSLKTPLINAILTTCLIQFVAGCAHPQEFTTPQPAEEELPITKSVKIVGYPQSLFDTHSGESGFVETTKYWKDPCEIIIVPPAHPEDNYAFCTIGHALWHCLTGSFHHRSKAQCGNPAN